MNMNCSKCGSALPDDSEFCQYCGYKLSVEDENTATLDTSHKESESSSSVATIPENYCGGPTPDISGLEAVPKETPADNRKKKFCKLCGGLIDAETKRCSSCGKQFFRFPKRVFSIIALIIVLAALAGLNVYQYVSNDATLSDMKQQLEENSITITGLEQQIKTQNSTISTQKSTIATQINKIAELGEKADYFDEICSFLSSGNIGYAADNFKSSDSIILVRKGETNHKFTLTAYWSNGGTVSTSYSNFLVAGVSYDNDNWSRSTTMTIDPISEGINIVTFTNDVDSKTFKIMILVF